MADLGVAVAAVGGDHLHVAGLAVAPQAVHERAPDLLAHVDVAPARLRLDRVLVLRPVAQVRVVHLGLVVHAPAAATRLECDYLLPY